MKKRMFKARVSTLLCCSLLMMSGCGAASSSTAEQSKPSSATDISTSSAAPSVKKEGTQHVSIVTGPVGGSMYVISSSFGDIVNKTSSNIQITNQVGGGSALCARVLANGEADFAMAGNDIAYYASRGEEVFEGEPVEDIRAVCALYAEGFHVIVRKDSGISKIEDLTNKKSTSIGPPGSGTLLNSERVLEAYGLNKDAVKAKELGFNESAESIRDGHINAACYMTGVPYGPVMDIAITQPINVFGLSNDVINKLMEKYPFFVKTHYPENTYEGTGAFDTIAVRMLLLTKEGTDEETVYQMTKTLVENLDQIAASHSCGNTISKETLLDGLSIPLHPGAERYYKEIGLL